MSERIEPALSAEEWARLRLGHHGCDARIDGDDLLLGSDCGGEPYAEMWPIENRAGLAALALHGQPFGFTRGDVDFLRNTTEHLAVLIRMTSPGADLPADNRKWLESIADRIAALLPPRQER